MAATLGDEDTNFLHFYQKFKFDENSSSHITAAGSERMQMVFDFYQSIKSNEDNATCLLLKSDLCEYSKIVDDKCRLNNYAQYMKSISNLSHHPVSDCSKWSSSLNLQQLPCISTKSRTSDSSDSSIKNIYFNLRKKFHDVNQKVNNQEVSCNDKTTNGFNPQNRNRLPNQNTETTSLNRIPAKSKDSRPNIFSFNKPTFGQANQQNNFNSNRRFEESEPKNNNESSSGFRTAKTELKIQNVKKYGNRGPDTSQPKETFSVKRSLGGRTRSVNNKFVPPIKNEESDKNVDDNPGGEMYEDERLKNLDPKMIELIKNEIMDNGNPITWDDIAGLQFAKTTIQEIVVWPLLRPDIFTGLRRPPKGILLFGPPGTGKTLIGKCIASQSSSTFFSISASSLTSKWIGDSEKLVRTLFAVARCYQPAVIFIDEIDSLLSQRSETEHESSRRIKTEFLVQLDGATTHDDDRILVIGATNRPQELDEAARRRLVKRLYIPLPEFEARCQIVNRLMKTEKNDLAENDVHEIAKLTDGYSGADMKNLCQEASLGPIRSIDFSQINSIESHEVRAVTISDFISALKVVRSSVSPSDLNQYLEWDKVYGSSGN